VHVRDAEIKRAADKGENIRELGFKESVRWLWQFSKRRYIENTAKSTKGKAVFGLGSSYSIANLQRDPGSHYVKILRHLKAENFSQARR